jgi:hypothetical protein
MSILVQSKASKSIKSSGFRILSTIIDQVLDVIYHCALTFTGAFEAKKPWRPQDVVGIQATCRQESQDRQRREPFSIALLKEHRFFLSIDASF